MCGLVLKFESTPEAVQNVTYALDKMKHRGTQTSTIHCKSKGLGFTRANTIENVRDWGSPAPTPLLL